MKHIWYSLFILFFWSLVLFGQETDTPLHSMIRADIENELNLRADEVILRLKSGPPAGDFDQNEWWIEQPKEGYQTGTQILWMHKKAMDNSRPVPVTISLTIYKPVLVAMQKLVRGQVLTAEGVRLERRQIRRSLETYFTDPDSAYGLEAKQIILPGTVLMRHMLKQPPDIRRGAEVSVHLMQGSVTIITAGISREDAMIGEYIRIRCAPEGKTLSGRLYSADLVIIE